MGSPEACAAAQALITPELLAQAEEICANWWDYHPRASLPEGRSLVAYSDGIWIVEEGCLLGELVRYARVADGWPVYLNRSRIAIVLNERAAIPISDAGRHRPLVLLAEPGGFVIAKVPAPAGGWDHDGLAAALEAQRDAIASAPSVRAMLGTEQFGCTLA